MQLSTIERLWQVNEEAEIWWDSSPLVFATWRMKMIEKADDQHEMRRWIDHLYDVNKDPENNLFRGVTTNPPLSYAAVQDDPDYWKGWIKKHAQDWGPQEVEETFWEVYKEIVKRGAVVYLPMFQKSGGKFGYISGQTDPRILYDADSMVHQGLELAALAPNVMVKIPGTAEGYKAIRRLSALGISTNNTLSMVVPQFVACMDAVTEGLAEARSNGVDTSAFRSVITAMSARYGTLGTLEKEAEDRGISLSETDIRWAEIAIFKKACRLVESNTHYPGKMLLCSMRMSPVIAGRARSWHIEKVAGENIVYTCPPSYIGDLLTNGTHMQFRDSREEEPPVAVLDKLLKIPYFAKAYAEDGYELVQFNTHPAVAATGEHFAQATENMVEFVAEALQEC